jgi:exodeoxyribonuclease VII small subunit
LEKEQPQAPPPSAADQTQFCFEDSLAEVERVVHELEEGRLGLSEALAQYEQGIKHLKQCFELLQQAERKIELLTAVTDNGLPVTEPFAEDAAPLEASAGRRRRNAP